MVYFARLASKTSEKVNQSIKPEQLWTRLRPVCLLLHGHKTAELPALHSVPISAQNHFVNWRTFFVS